MPESRTEHRLLAFCATLAEACWLVALATVPLVVDLFGDGTFEPPKVRLLESIAWLLAGALLVTVGLRGRQVLAATRRNPIVLAALGVGLSAILSTILSIAPSASLWGNFQRAQGLSTILCYLLVFAATSTWIRRTAQAWRLVGAIIVAGSLVAIVGLGQQLGVDPLEMIVDTTRRAPSTLGNPIFMAACLGFGILLAIAAAVAASGFDRAVWAAAALVQGLAFIGAGSRGPTIGLLAGLGLLVWLLFLGRRWTTTRAHPDGDTPPPTRWGAAAAISGVLLVIIIAVSVGPLRANLERLAGMSRGATVRVRLDAWEAVSRTMLSPRATAAALRTDWPELRMPFGYGLETAGYPLNLHISGDLPALTKNEDRLDRAHNVVMQQLVERGSIGVVALLALWFLLLRAAISGARSPARSPAAPAATTAMLAVAAGLLTPWLVAGSVAWSGLGAAVALAAVVLWPVLIGGWRESQQAAPEENLDRRQRRILMVGVGAALLAHFVELQSGIAVTPTSLAFWALAGLLASPWAQGKPPPEEPRQTSNWTPWIVGIATGALLVSITTPPNPASGPLASARELLGIPAQPSATTALVMACLATTALLASTHGRGWRRRSASVGIALAIACGITILASLPLDLAPSFRGGDPVGYAASLAASAVARMAITVLVVLLLARARPWRAQWRAVARRERLAGVLLLTATLGALAGPHMWAAAAATFSGVAGGDARAGRTGPATALYRQALALQPAAAARWRGLARVHRLAAEHEPGMAINHVAESRTALERAVQLTPMASEVHGELGTILMQQAISSPADPAPLLAAAVAHLERALELRPSSQRALTTLRSALALQAAIGVAPSPE